MKKMFCVLLSSLIVLSSSSMACAASDPKTENDTFSVPPVVEPVATENGTFSLPPALEPLALVYINNNVSSDAVFETPYFSCVSGNGNSLRYWFQNNGSSTCTVQLYAKSVLGLLYTQPPFTVAAGGQKSQVFPNPGSTTFKIKVTANDGGTVIGKLRANQLNLTSN